MSSEKWPHPLKVGCVVTAFQPSCQIPSSSEHRIELGVLGGGDVAGIEAVPHAHALNRVLGVPLHRVRQVDADAVEQSRDDVNGVMVLISNLATGIDALRPRDDAWVAGSTVERVPASTS